MYIMLFFLSCHRLYIYCIWVVLVDLTIHTNSSKRRTEMIECYNGIYLREYLFYCSLKWLFFHRNQHLIQHKTYLFNKSFKFQDMSLLH